MGAQPICPASDLLPQTGAVLSYLRRPAEAARCAFTQKERRMADDLKKKGPEDQARINVNEAHEVRYWTET